MNDTDPITQAVEQFIASIPAADFEDKPVLQALLNWFRSQDVDRAHLCSAMATLLCMFVCMVAEDKADMKEGVSIYAKQIRAVASVSMEAKQVASQ